ncbi:MAG: class I SAM-dependent methyltransferase [Verrucomicrobia bacterium]|nr:class I SAM-dependent methyltransferase [Verrucomicrobiota bacterium]
MKDMEDVVCNICGSNNFEKKYYTIRSGFLVQCTNCGLYYANPRRTASIQSVLNNTTPTERYESKTLNYQGRLLEFNFILDTIEKLKAPSGRLLDIGCYEGYFLHEARNKGWNCYGVEPNRGGASYAQNVLHLNVKQCVLEKTGFERNSFDVITVLATLEHIPDPYSLLMKIREIMKEDGILIVTVPTVPFYLPFIRSKWRMFIGDHYYFFTDTSMNNLLNKAGFELNEPGKYITKQFDLETMSDRLSNEWQPNNLGRVGVAIKWMVKKLHVGQFTISANLYDSKIYVAHKRC